MSKIKGQQLNLQVPPIGLASYGQGSDNTIANASFGYINQTNFKTTINVKKGGCVLVFLMITGWSHSNAGYSTNFNVGMDGASTLSNSGAIGFAMQGANGMGQLCMPFIFTNVPAGDHTFYGLWNSGNASNTSKIATWASVYMVAVELSAPIG